MTTKTVICCGRPATELAAAYALYKLTLSDAGGSWAVTSGPTQVEALPGRSLMRPMVSADSDIMCADMPTGTSPDINIDYPKLRINGVSVDKPGDIWGWGHWEWSPDSQYICWAYSPGPFQPFKAVITRPDTLDTRTRVGPDGCYDPSWPDYGSQILLCNANYDPVRYNLTGLTVRHGPYAESGYCYDPYLSPAGTHMIYLRKNGLLDSTGAIRIRRLGQSTRTLIAAPTDSTLQSHANWLGPNDVILNRKAPSQSWFELWSCNINTGTLTKLTNSTGLSLEYVSPVPDTASI